jgi:hypothetical protein
VTATPRSALFRLAAAVAIAEYAPLTWTDAPMHTTPTDKDQRDALLRTHMFRTPEGAPDRCDGCGISVKAGAFAFYRVVDGALFHSAACAALHATAPLDTTRRLA